MSATTVHRRSGHRDRRHDHTPDSHGFDTRPYDLVKELVIALVVVLGLTTVLSAAFSSPDEKAITLRDWASAAPNDVVATAAGELAGTTTSASYGAPYNAAGEGQKLGPLALQKWAGVRLPVDSAKDLVITPLAAAYPSGPVHDAVAAWNGAAADQRATWATAYSDALAKAPDGDPAKVASGDYGPVPDDRGRTAQPGSRWWLGGVADVVRHLLRR